MKCGGSTGLGWALCWTLLLLLAVPAWAARPEVPCDGVDNGDSSGTWGSCGAGYHNALFNDAGTANTGCDLSCPELDKDGDGYNSTASAGHAGTSYKDCDDANFLIFPGNYYPCDCGTGANSGYRICNTNGTYGTCTCTATTVLCEKTGSGHCYYIDVEAGDDGNAGTYAAPFATLEKVSNVAGDTPLVAGDVVYFINDGTLSHTFVDDQGRTALAYFSSVGTSSDKIRIKRYPGSTAILSAAAVIIGFATTARYYVVEDLAISKASTERSAIIDWGQHSEYSRCYFYDIIGNGDNNSGAIYLGNTIASNVHHSFFRDVYGDEGNQGNLGAIVLINDGADANVNHLVQFNTVWWTRATNSDCAITNKCAHAVDVKHGIGEAAPSGTSYIRYNKFIWPNDGIKMNSSGWTMTNNLIVEPVGKALYQHDDATYPNGESNVFSYNTVVNGQALNWNYPHYSDAEDTTFSYNVFVDDAGSYNCENALVMIDGYGSDAQEAQFDGGYLIPDNNCYYNGSTAAVFNYFCQDTGGHGPAGTEGDSYSFTNWKTAGGNTYDTNSFEENPKLDSVYRATAANCDDKGYLLTSEEPAVAAIMSTLD
jgi:hypothetical protein